MHLLAIISIICVVVGLIKEACTPTLTAEHWANKELEHKDRMSGMSEKETGTGAGVFFISGIHWTFQERVLHSFGNRWQSSGKRFG